VGGMRAKIGLTFGALALVLLTMASYAVSNMVSQRIEADISAAMLRAAHLVSFTFDREIEERQRDLQALATLFGTQQAADDTSPPTDPMRALLKEYSTRYGMQHIAFVDREGRVRVASDTQLDGRDMSAEPWFRAALIGPHASDLQTPAAGNTASRYLDLAVPVFDAAGGVAGVLMAQLWEPWVDSLRDRLRMLAPPDQQHQLEVFVTASDGRLMTAHNARGAAPAAARTLASGTCAHGAEDGDGATSYLTCAVVSAGYKAFKGLGWRVTIRLPEHVAFAAADKLERQIAWTGLIATVFFGLVGWLLADRISQPIVAMARAADRIASGERELELPLAGRDETAQLARSLSSLLSRLRQDEAALVRTNQALEARVAERTLRLEKAVADLQDANTDLDRFASMVSHDLLAPVRAMRTFSELLQMDFADSLPAEAQRLLKRIDQAGLDMNNLVHALHALSKLGQKPLQVAQADMAAIAEQTVQSNLPAWNEKTIHIGPMPPSRCDASMMRIVFENLIGNAVKYSQRQPEPQIVVGGENNGDTLVYWVADNGAGFDPQYAHRLFQIFQRLHSARDYPGTGVGLATVAKIVSRHGGRVWAEGTPGEGATFYFSLPIGEMPAKGIGADELPVSAGTTPPSA